MLSFKQQLEFFIGLVYIHLIDVPFMGIKITEAILSINSFYT